MSRDIAECLPFLTSVIGTKIESSATKGSSIARLADFVTYTHMYIYTLVHHNDIYPDRVQIIYAVILHEYIFKDDLVH